MKPPMPALADLKPVTTLDGVVRPLTQKELERLWSNVSMDGAGCWIWTGLRFQAGYGNFSLESKSAYTHRIMYMIFVGSIPQGLHTDHLCRVRECCNPEHLEVVTCRENILRSPIAPAAINAAKTHCKRGHSLSGDNLELLEDGGRRCRTCAIAAARKRYAEATGTPLNEATIDLSTPPAPRRQRDSDACAKGHPLDALNTYTDPKGYRHCRACRAAAQSRHDAKKRERR
jgi:hypothetical protein